MAECLKLIDWKLDRVLEDENLVEVVIARRCNRIGVGWGIIYGSFFLLYEKNVLVLYHVTKTFSC